MGRMLAGNMLGSIMAMQGRRATGFTLVELMTVVAVVAILAAIAFPSFQSTLRSNRVATANNAMIAALSEARSEAVRNTRGGGVCGSRTGTACDGTLADGWLVFADLDGNGTFGGNDTVVRFERPATGLTVTADVDAPIAFDRRGRLATGSAQSVAVQPVSCGNAPLLRTLTISPTGQVKSAKGNCS